MDSADDRIASFESRLLRPALDEVCEARQLLLEYTATVVTPEVEVAPVVRELVDVLERAGAGGRRAGPSLVIENRERDPSWPNVGGRYVMTPFYEVDDDDIFVAPGVLFWMRFNDNFHVFHHRYDNAVAEMSIDDVTREQILDHALNSLEFYRRHAFSEEPFPGFRSPHQA